MMDGAQTRTVTIPHRRWQDDSFSEALIMVMVM
jgi:hypothetical protein